MLFRSLELLPTVANGFLRKRRAEEWEKTQAAAAPKVEEKPAVEAEPVTGPTLNAPMGGRIVEIKVKPGDKIKFVQTMLVYEAMKMENDLSSEIDGTVKRILVAPDQVVATDQALIEYE